MLSDNNYSKIMPTLNSNNCGKLSMLLQWQLTNNMFV